MPRIAAENGLLIRDPGPPPGARRGPGRPRKRSQLLTAAWQSAATVDPVAVAAYTPSEPDMAVGLALLGGARLIDELVTATKLTREEVDAVLCSPVRMAWISSQVYTHFQQRAAMVDTALYSRAVAGDVGAIRLFYERMGKMTTDRKVAVTVSGGINVSALSDGDLRKLIADGNAQLPAPAPPPVLESRVIDAEFTETACPTSASSSN